MRKVFTFFLLKPYFMVDFSREKKSTMINFQQYLILKMWCGKTLSIKSNKGNFNTRDEI